jgi:TPR repeat protein
MYRNGWGITKNMHSVIERYTKAATNGHPRAQYELGDVYENENGFKDLKKAVYWYQKANDNDGKATEKVKELNNQGYYAKEGQKDIDYYYKYKNRQ